MDRKLLRNLERSFARRGGTFGIAASAPPEITRAFLEALLDCPDCRGAIVEACNADDRKEVDIDEVMQDLGLTHGH